MVWTVIKIVACTIQLGKDAMQLRYDSGDHSSLKITEYLYLWQCLMQQCMFVSNWLFAVQVCQCKH